VSSRIERARAAYTEESYQAGDALGWSQQSTLLVLSFAAFGKEPT